MTGDDLALLVELNSDVEVMRHLTGRPSSPAEVASQLAESLGTRWLVFSSTDEVFLGWVAAFPSGAGEFELGWRFRRAAWGRGYATEAAGALLDAVFAAGATRVFAQTMAVNQASRAVMDRLGMRHVRTFHLELDDPLPGTEVGEMEYELTRVDWLHRH